MDKAKLMNGVKKYTMIIVLVLVTLFFTWQTGGKILLPQNVSNLISQNAYVFVLATGMLLCILTGGNIDLSVGSVVCFAGAVGATLMESKGMNPWAASIMMLDRSSDRCMAGFLDCICTCTSFHYNTVRYVGIPWTFKRCTERLNSFPDKCRIR